MGLSQLFLQGNAPALLWARVKALRICIRFGMIAITIEFMFMMFTIKIYLKFQLYTRKM